MTPPRFALTPPPVVLIETPVVPPVSWLTLTSVPSGLVIVVSSFFPQTDDKNRQRRRQNNRSLHRWNCESLESAMKPILS